MLAEDRRYMRDGSTFDSIATVSQRDPLGAP